MGNFIARKHVAQWQAAVSWNFSLDEYFSGILHIILKKRKKKDKGKKLGLGICILFFPGLVGENTF